MPGILPMKVIKVGNTSQSRIAQACDRCRSKKIRCDGFRPTCSQCANVGFECKTSDKLSRRAFPRGYTESLEERVRSLEGETRELKDLLDEKDEKIDMLSRMQSQARQRRGSAALSSRRASSSTATATPEDVRSSLQQEREESFKVLQSPLLHAELNNDAYFMGASSGRSFIDAFKQKVQESGRPCCTLNPDVFFPSTDQAAILPPSPVSPPASSWVAPPRIMSDKMVNIFFQEWAPLFPTLHKPSFLTLYETYVGGAEVVDTMQSLAQLNLVFGIAALSSTNLDISSDIQRCEVQWKAALETFMLEASLTNLQCLILAQIFCIQKGDVSSLLHYKSLAVGISHRLGLHQSQKRFALGALTGETRKKVFWSLYVLDSFSAAFMGLPRLIKEDDVHCEYPVDVDDEYVTEQGFQPTLPGEATKISAALALFRVCRILARTLDDIYPAATSHEVSLRTISDLEADLEEWSEDLPAHLRLQFIQGKPSTNIISSRCPLLSLAYHYIHVLIHRPVVCANVDTQSSASLLAVATSSKSIIQIVQLLQERNLSFSFCLNRNDVLISSGFGLLFQALDLEAEGKLLHDYSRLLVDVCGLLQSGMAPGTAEFRGLCQNIVCLGDADMLEPEPLIESLGDDDNGLQPMVQTVYQPSLAAARYTSSKSFRKERRDTKEFQPSQQSPVLGSGKKASKRGSFSTTPLSPLQSSSKSSQPRGQLRGSRSNSSSMAHSVRPILSNDASGTNLDFFTFPSDPEPGVLTRPHSGPASGEWEQLLASLDTSQSMLYETLCKPTPKPTTTVNTGNAASASSMLSPTAGDPSSPEILSLGNKYQSLYGSPDDDPDPLLHTPDWPSSSWSLGLESSTVTSTMAPPDMAGSVLSFSDDSLTSGGEEFSSVGDVNSSHSNSNAGFHGIGLPLDILSEAVDADSLDFEELTV